MRKSDLKDGMVVEIRWNAMGDKRYLILGDRLVCKDGYTKLGTISEDLILLEGRGCAIQKVFTVNDEILNLEELFLNKRLDLIWKRPEELNWSGVELYTKVQVRDYEDSKWINKYFIRRDDNGQFVVSSIKNDDFTGVEGMEYEYRYCRLFKEEN